MVKSFFNAMHVDLMFSVPSRTRPFLRSVVLYYYVWCNVKCCRYFVGLRFCASKKIACNIFLILSPFSILINIHFLLLLVIYQHILQYRRLLKMTNFTHILCYFFVFSKWLIKLSIKISTYLKGALLHFADMNMIEERRKE